MGLSIALSQQRMLPERCLGTYWLAAHVSRSFPRQLQVVPYEPVPCKSCGAVLNPYSRCDFTAKLWICPFCHARNHFPAHYQVRIDASARLQAIVKLHGWLQEVSG